MRDWKPAPPHRWTSVEVLATAIGAAFVIQLIVRLALHALSH